MNTIVVGLQHGDEGKGGVCDFLMKDHDICVRYSGGPNTGATVQVGEKSYKFHHIPVGVLQNKPSYIAAGCVIDGFRLQREILDLEELGVNVTSNLKISPDCHKILREHVERDEEREESKAHAVGSTKRGVGPSMEDKFGRRGRRLRDARLGEFDFKSYWADVPAELNRLMHDGKSILFEGTQGTELDIDHGDYPNISTSSNVAGYACASSGVGPTNINRVLGVFKPYLTKVGTGNFPTEISDKYAQADELVKKGHEYGTTTGRKRKVGWLDIPALKRAIMINGCTDLAMTKFDVLEGTEFFVGEDYFDNGKPFYKRFDNPSREEFVKYLTKTLGVKVKYLSTGPSREQMEIL